jgi:hypothetical protein
MKELPENILVYSAEFAGKFCVAFCAMGHVESCPVSLATVEPISNSFISANWKPYVKILEV